MPELGPPPSWPGANRRLVLGGMYVPPVQLLGTFSSEQFEIFAHEWAYGYLLKKAGRYSVVEGAPGAGDKGRDVIAWIDPEGTEPRRWDCYQCKHYGQPLQPNDVWIELGKLCYYTFNGDYTVPERYYFVAPEGVGQKLLDLLKDADRLRAGLIEQWDQHCRRKITAKVDIPLDAGLRAHIDAFDFGRISHVPVHELIDQHAQTPYHAFVFGVSLQVPPPPPNPPPDIQPNEARYVEHIYDAFSDHLRAPISARGDFAGDTALTRQFNHARESFYCAESMKAFARESLPPPVTYEELLDEIADGIQPTLDDPSHQDAYIRMIRVTECAQGLALSGHMLRDHLKPKYRAGMCHQLSNEDRVTWVRS